MLLLVPPRLARHLARLRPRRGVTFDRYELSLFAKNLFDNRAFVPEAFYFYDAVGFPIDIKAPVLQPRTIGVSIDKSF